MKKKVIIASAVGLIVMGVIVGSTLRKGKKKANQTVHVRLETVQPDEFVEIINAPGEIRPETEVDISAKVSARIVELPFDEGDRVTAEEPSLLVRLDSKNLDSQLRSAVASRDAQQARTEVEKANLKARKASLEGTRASLKQAERELERQTKLLESQDISQASFDQVESNVKQLRSQYETAVHSIEAAELNLTVMKHNLTGAEARIEEVHEALSHTTIYSPIDGVITQLNAEVGEVVMTGTMNNPGTVILQVADLSTMTLLAEVDETNIGQIRIGQPAKIHIPAFWEEEFDGIVQNIALTQRLSRTGAKYYKTEILVTGDVSTLYSGMTADVDIETNRYDEVIKVPSQAVLVRRLDSLPLDITTDNPTVDTKKIQIPVVYRLIDGKTVVTPVTIGPSDLTHTLIREGLNVGDVIVVGPYKILEGLYHNQSAKEETDYNQLKPQPKKTRQAKPRRF
ncbi:MAG: efflux RND transporter periplasmic adaptor subunit [Planctomycetota bacterium]|jgi:HlyD family secretion protein